MWLTVDEGVQDGHGAVGDTGVGVDLLEDWRMGCQQTRFFDKMDQCHVMDAIPL